MKAGFFHFRDFVLRPELSFRGLRLKIQGNKKLGPWDPRLNYVQIRIADADGRFKFESVPAGEYFVTTTIIWEIPSRSGLQRQGGLVTKRISVEDGQEIEIIIHRFERYAGHVNAV